MALKAGRITTALLIGSGSVAFGGGAVSLAGSGAKSGDLFVAFGHSLSSTVSLNGVAITPVAGAASRFFLKILTQQEITAGGTASTAAWWLVVRGPSTGSIRTSGTAAGVGPTLAGFTKSQFSAGFIYGGAATGATAQPLISQPGYTMLGYLQGAGNPASYLSAAHNLSPATYTNGASIPTQGSSNGSTSANILELTF
ncbi:hypothetical protein [Phenylobacterium sp.]|uniref:hypothetical protein n=1 Tax=Phenylobacterium sp. TaxID=1871053 RepID=UPI0027316B43|nr:hypothetical protein [Phenylobacterium sp.]MDP1599026.1 hypothetical protein [Phenylobacterium sp.]